MLRCRLNVFGASTTSTKVGRRALSVLDVTRRVMWGASAFRAGRGTAGPVWIPDGRRRLAVNHSSGTAVFQKPARHQEARNGRCCGQASGPTTGRAMAAPVFQRGILNEISCLGAPLTGDAAPAACALPPRPSSTSVRASSHPTRTGWRTCRTSPRQNPGCSDSRSSSSEGGQDEDFCRAARPGPALAGGATRQELFYVSLDGRL